MFVDEVRIFVASGKGGDGAVTFHREKYRPKGGPDGGDGGRGGSVVLIADEGISSLALLKDHPHQKAKFGGRGAGNNKTGPNAPDLEIRVPPGTLVSDEGGTRLADLASPGDRVVLAKGGRGGRGNAAFKTHERRAPGFAELGEPGEEMWLKLELRLLADVAVIGFPNSGKSTLVSAVSAARPKVADYAFTTLEPSLGVVEVGDERFTICDVPGLIEGAHKGKGLGLQFLRHAERAPVFLHLIDLASGRDPLRDFEIINGELRKFRKELANRPQVVALNKTDAVEEVVVNRALERFAGAGTTALAISAERGLELDQVVGKVWGLVRKARDDQPESAGFELFRTVDDSVSVSPEGGGWRIQSSAVKRWVAMTDMSNPEAVAYLQKRLDSAGVERALIKAGANPGDEVKIGSVAFEWWPAGSDPDDEEGSRGSGRRRGGQAGKTSLHNRR